MTTLSTCRSAANLAAQAATDQLLRRSTTSLRRQAAMLETQATAALSTATVNRTARTSAQVTAERLRGYARCLRAEAGRNETALTAAAHEFALTA